MRSPTAPATSPLEAYPEQVRDLLRFMTDSIPEDHRFHGVRAAPVGDSMPEPWLLGSAYDSAQFAAEQGLGFAFAHFISPDGGPRVVQAYRDHFQPSALFPEPRVIVGLAALCAEDDEAAHRIAMSRHLMRLRRAEGRQSIGIPSIEEALTTEYTEPELDYIKYQQSLSVEGNPRARARGPRGNRRRVRDGRDAGRDHHPQLRRPPALVRAAGAGVRHGAGLGGSMRVGLISDTHLPSLIRHLDQLGPEAAEFLATVDLILHAGDVVTREVLDWCERFAPVLAARGNHDVFEDPRIEEAQVMTLEGWRIGMVHDLRPVATAPADHAREHFGGATLDVMVSGDTHVERLEYRDGVVMINSGSPNLPHHKETRLGTVALLELEPGRLRAEIILLGHSPGTRNPGTGQHLELVEGRVVAASLDGVALALADES